MSASSWRITQAAPGLAAPLPASTDSRDSRRRCPSGKTLASSDRRSSQEPDKRPVSPDRGGRPGYSQAVASGELGEAAARELRVIDSRAVFWVDLALATAKGEPVEEVA